MEVPQTGRPGLIVSQRRFKAINRLAAATLKGTVGMLNNDFANASYLGIDGEVTAHNRNVVATTADGAVVNDIVVADEAIPVGKEGWWRILSDGEDVLVANGAALGDLLYVAGAGDTFLTGMADTVAALEALAVPRKIVGRLYAANASGATAARRCRFAGFGMVVSTGFGA